MASGGEDNWTLFMSRIHPALWKTMSFEDATVLLRGYFENDDIGLGLKGKLCLIDMDFNKFNEAFALITFDSAQSARAALGPLQQLEWRRVLQDLNVEVVVVEEEDKGAEYERHAFINPIVKWSYPNADKKQRSKLQKKNHQQHRKQPQKLPSIASPPPPPPLPSTVVASPETVQKPSPSLSSSPSPSPAAADVGYYYSLVDAKKPAPHGPYLHRGQRHLRILVDVDASKSIVLFMSEAEFEKRFQRGILDQCVEVPFFSLPAPHTLQN